MGRQVESGKAFEYAIAISSSTLLGCDIVPNDSFEYAMSCFNKQSDLIKNNIMKASYKSVEFILKKEGVNNTFSYNVSIQSDSRGGIGDVRDVIIDSNDSSVPIGFSAKHRHHAVKHSRLSRSIDFGNKWFGVPNRDRYWDKVTPVLMNYQK